mmetsp:Transcript_53710/g.174681  ORF Transcript_53710/g.174681 Transcript_53710/m.174681 type:complete len:295 (+) Transcript_53710:498-1382(+)
MLLQLPVQRECQPWQKYPTWPLIPKLVVVEVARRGVQVLGPGILLLEQIRSGLQPGSVGRVVVVVGLAPEAMFRVALELCQADVLGWPTIAVRAICSTGGRSIARTLARETVPNAACKVRRRAWVGVHGLELVAADKIAILVIHVIALAGARALLAVVCVTDPEVHTLLQQTCRSSHLHFVAQDPRDAELRRVRDHHLMLQVPHDSCQVRCVDVLWRIARAALGPVHVEAVERAIAGADRRRGRWRGRRGCRRRLAFVCEVCATIAVAGALFIVLATALPRIGAATSVRGARGR